MATFIRLLIGLISGIFFAVAPLALVVSTSAFRGSQSGSIVAAVPILIVCAALSSMSPLLTGTLASYWSWRDAESRVRLRRILIILIAVQAVSLAGVAVTGAIEGAAIWVLVLFIVVAILLTPALIALGRVALRHDHALRATADEWVDTTRADLRKGYRKGAIGFAIGLAAGVALLVVLGALLSSAGHHRDPFASQTLLLAVSFAFLGGAIGMIATTFRISRRIRQAVGGEYGSARRIGRVVVRGKAEELNSVEQRNAVRYALIVGQWFPFQAVQFVLLYLGILLEQASSLFDDKQLDGFRIVTIALLIAFAIALVPLQLSRGRRARTYASTHAQDSL